MRTPEQPADGQRMGCGDSGPPEGTDEQTLSRVLDALRALHHFPDQKESFWAGLPAPVRLAYGWSSWQYRAEASWPS